MAHRAAFVLAGMAVTLAGLGAGTVLSDPLPPDATYRPLPTVPPDVVRRNDEAMKPAVMQRQRQLLEARYDLADRPMPGARMSAGRKPVQAGVRVRLPAGTTWDQLAAMTPEEIRDRGLWPAGFLPLPHTKQTAGGQVFPEEQIDEILRAERRSLQRFDVDFDLPEHLTPEFPPPIFLANRTELGDVSGGELLTIRNYYAKLVGILTPVQMEGLVSSALWP